MTIARTLAESDAGKTLAALVREALDGIPWSRARSLCEQGKVTLDGQVERDPARRVAAGMAFEVNRAARRLSRGVLRRESIVYVDSDVVVVDKPAGLLAVPYEAGDKDTLLDITQAALRKRPSDPQRTPLGVVQRLDKDTTGLMVFARHLRAKRHLAAQLREHSVARRYLALVHGRAESGTHDTRLVGNRGDGLRGSWGVYRRAKGGPPGDARRAITHVRVLERLLGATLVECQLETGRQHQIRIHLSEAGNPLLGETVYVRDYPGVRLEAPRILLHAAHLGFVHPRTEDPVAFDAEPPEDFREALAKLRP